MKKQRGRKAGTGTLEAREFVKTGQLEKVLKDPALVADSSLTEEGAKRIIKAVKFGLGIKETKTEEE